MFLYIFHSIMKSFVSDWCFVNCIASLFCVPSVDFNAKIMKQTSTAVSTPSSGGIREVVVTCQYQQSPLWRHVDSNPAACLTATGTLQAVSQWGRLLQTVMSRPDSHYLTPRAAESLDGLSVGGWCDWDGCPASQSLNQSINTVLICDLRSQENNTWRCKRENNLRKKKTKQNKQPEAESNRGPECFRPLTCLLTKWSFPHHFSFCHPPIHVHSFPAVWAL